jgi:hypothetical protein
MSTAQHHTQPTQGTQLLRRRLQEHWLTEFQNPILAALQGSGLSPLEVFQHWYDLELQAQRAHDDVITTGTIQDAQAAQHQKRLEIAQRLLTAKNARPLP